MLAFMMLIGVANAQNEPAKFTDNITLELRGGVSTQLTDMYMGVSPVVGVGIEKYVSPWLGFAIDANTLISNPWGSANPHTAFDVLNANILGKVNVLNIFNYNEKRRFFEPVLFAGVGVGHRTCSEYITDVNTRDNYVYGKNYLVTKTGAEFNFNVGKEREWAIRVTPAVIWGPCHNAQLNAKNGGFEVTVGLAYHFKNSNGKRVYTRVIPRNQQEVDQLGALIAELNYERGQLKKANRALVRKVAELEAREPEIVTQTDTVYVNLNSHSYFKAGSATIASMAEIRNLAKTLDKTKHYVVVGYASEEGSKEYNDNLSKKRAENIYNALIKFGFPEGNLSFKGEGPTTQFSTSERDANRVVVVEQK